MAESIDDAVAHARLRTLAPRPAFEYDLQAPASVLLRFKGTFWPLIMNRYEVYVFPAIHTALIVYNYFYPDVDGEPDPENPMILPGWILHWSTIGWSSTLMNFFLVFFVGQCYGRFNAFFKTTLNIEASVQETAMACLVHVTKDLTARWDVVRYLVASSLIIYFRVAKLAEFQDAMVNVSELDRMLTDEREWLKVSSEVWEKLMGWPRSRAEAQEYTALLHSKLGLSNEQPSRLANSPALLTKTEVEELRKYPGGMMSLTLQTWALQRAAATKEFKPPWFNALQGSVFKLRAAAYSVRAELSLPVPLPYFHSLNFLQNMNYAYMSYALLFLNSNLTPIVLLVYIIITVGMREVAAALANPFGDDEVDFPVHKYITRLRGIALAVHESNNPINWHTVPTG